MSCENYIIHVSIVSNTDVDRLAIVAASTTPPSRIHMYIYYNLAENANLKNVQANINNNKN